MKKSFTIIELIIVIVILGIVAAVALPKFISLKDDAEKSVIEGIVGSIRSAKTLFLAKMALCPGTQYSSIESNESDPNLLYLFIAFSPEGDQRTFKCNGDGTAEWANFFAFDRQLRKSIMKDPEEQIWFAGNDQIKFETKSGRTVKIYYDNNTRQILWSATPSY